VGIIKAAPVPIVPADKSVSPITPAQKILAQRPAKDGVGITRPVAVVAVPTDKPAKLITHAQGPLHA